MIARLRPYPEYNDSEVEWLGKVPAAWRLLPGRDAFREIVDRTHPREQMLSVTIRQGVVRQADLLEETAGKDSSNVEKSAYKLVLPGDLAYNKMRAWQGAIGVSRHRGIVSPAYVVVRPRRLNPTYAHYLLRIPAFASEAERWSYGITSDQWSLRAEDFRRIYFCVPSLPEQVQIVRFLDHFDSRIQRLIAGKERLIDLLGEEKQAIVDRALTRGVDPGAPLKPSGMEWFGDIPAHWSVRRLHELTNDRRPIMYGIVLPGPDVNEGVFIVKGGNCEPGKLAPEYLSKTTFEIEARYRRSRLRAGDIVIAIRGGVGAAEMVPRDLAGANLTQDAARVAPRRGVSGLWLLAALRSHKVQQHIRARMRGATVTGINIRDLKRIPIPVPPLAEQVSIAEVIGEEMGAVGRAAGRARREISLLRELRTRLICDVVTGKLDVREAAADLPPDDDGDESPLDERLEEALA